MSVKVRRCDESARANGECVASGDGVVGACTAAEASAANSISHGFCCGLVAEWPGGGKRYARPACCWFMVSVGKSEWSVTWGGGAGVML